ncbi:hypothetical protein F4859DRAFT_283925 [Xylaria cf. heliscus]|nr:hypothetical protein F4859DRAFT_283925 [Xylaria cf. heliscus]
MMSPDSRRLGHVRDVENIEPVSPLEFPDDTSVAGQGVVVSGEDNALPHAVSVDSATNPVPFDICHVP